MATRSVVTTFLPKEEDEQIIVAQYLNHKDIFWIHPPNEGKRTPWRAAKLKKMGLLPGAVDILVLQAPPNSPGARGVLLEMKRRKGGVVSPAQQEFFTRAAPHGWLCKVARGSDEAIEYLQSLGW